MRPLLAVFAICFVSIISAAQSTQPLSVSPDSPRWDLQGQAKLAEYQGRKCLLLDGGVAVLKDFELRDGVIDVDVATQVARGFFGMQFRVVDDGATAEWVYLRQHKSPIRTRCNTRLCFAQAQTGNSTMGRASRVPSIFQGMPGFTSDLK
jgi:hypothetical protein